MLDTENSVSLERMAFSVDETAHILSLSRSTVKEQLYLGKLKGRKVGRKWVIPRWAIDEFLAATAPASVSAIDD